MDCNVRLPREHEHITVKAEIFESNQVCKEMEMEFMVHVRGCRAEMCLMNIYHKLFKVFLML